MLITRETRKTKAYSANGRYHYPNATLDLFNLDKIIGAQLRDEKQNLQQSSDYNVMEAQRAKKKQRQSGRVTPVVVVRFQEKHGTPKFTQLIALLDSGCTSSIMEEQFAKKLRKKVSPKTAWNTAAGNFHTNGKCAVTMQFPQLSETMTIKKDVHLTKNLSSRYDMVIGTDLMKELGIQLDFRNDLIHMGTTQVSMTDIDALPSLRQSIRSFYGNRSHSSNARQGMRSQPKPMRPNLQRNTTTADAHFTTGIEEPKSAAEAVERVKY